MLSYQKHEPHAVCSSRRAVRVAAACAIVLAVHLIVLHQRELAERGRLVWDKLVCTPHISAAAQEAAKVELGAVDCSHPDMAELTIPSIYVAEHEVLQALQLQGACNSCTEMSFLAQLKQNSSGALVQSPREAQFIFVPFPAKCAEPCKDARGAPISFRKAVEAARPLAKQHGAQLFTISSRPWTERTNFGKESRELFKEFDDVIFLSPEIKNIQPREMKSSKMRARFQRHIATPQWPLNFDIYTEPFDSEWKRPYKFCFQGTLLNGERERLTASLKQRNDSYVRANCRTTRSSDAASVLTSDSSAQLYSQCQFCPLAKGDSNSDTRLFDAMRTGCLPVSLNRFRPLPYAHWVDYDSWFFRVDAQSVQSHSLLFNQLERLSDREISRMRKAMLNSARQLTNSQCNGETGLKLALASLILDRTDLKDAGDY